MKQQFNGLYCAAHCTEVANLFFSAPPDTKTDHGRLTDAIARYWISFYKHGDPNTARATGAPEWPSYGLAAQNIAFALPDGGGIYTEGKYRQTECDYWDKLAGGPDR
jgi:carboxylesterase type B